MRHGDLAIYFKNEDGSDVRGLTNGLGPDAGLFSSRDGQKIVSREREIYSVPELEDYRRLLEQELWRPAQLEMFSWMLMIRMRGSLLI